MLQRHVPRGIFFFSFTFSQCIPDQPTAQKMIKLMNQLNYMRIDLYRNDEIVFEKNEVICRMFVVG